MNKFNCYRPHRSDHNVAYYCRQDDGYWFGFDKYGNKVRDTAKLCYITDNTILDWLRRCGGEIVDGPVYEERFEPKLYLNVWGNKIWYILFTNENDRYTLYLHGERSTYQPYHQNHKSYIEYSRLIKPFWGDNWIWEEIKDSNKDTISNLVLEKGTHNYA